MLWCLTSSSYLISNVIGWHEIFKHDSVRNVASNDRIKVMHQNVLTQRQRLSVELCCNLQSDNIITIQNLLHQILFWIIRYLGDTVLVTRLYDTIHFAVRAFRKTVIHTLTPQIIIWGSKSILEKEHCKIDEWINGVYPRYQLDTILKSAILLFK